MRNRIYSGVYGGIIVEYSIIIVCCVYVVFMLLQMKIFREDKCFIFDYVVCVFWYIVVILFILFLLVDIFFFNKNSNMYLYIRFDIYYF